MKSPAFGNPMTNVDDEFVVFERHVLQDNILLCDAKSGILVIFAAGVLWRCVESVADFVIPDPGLAGYVSDLYLILYILAVPAWLVAAYWAVRTVSPRIGPSDDSIYWGAPLFLKSQDEFVSAIRGAAPDAQMDGMLRHLHSLGAICRDKDGRFHKAVRATEVAAIFFLSAEVIRFGVSLLRFVPS
jgi:hypothetical protein